MSGQLKAGLAKFVGGAVLALVACAGCAAKSDAAAVADAPTTTNTPSAAPSVTLGDSGSPAPSKRPAPATSTTTRSQPPPAWPSPEDCISYNPANVTVQFQLGFYTVSDGGQVVVRVPGQTGDTVGDKALALAQRFRKHCFLGRDNTREDKNSYIFDYWRNPSGMTPTIPEQEDDCSSYDRSNLTVEDMGNGYGWRVKDHDHVLHLFDSERDARNGKLVLMKYHQICSIGNSDSDDQDVVSYSL